jgi:purine-binding chemotaxis protein CheW
MMTQYLTFSVGQDLYGIEVMRVQEVTSHLPIIPVPLAPAFVQGLINLRGQIATALGLKELFGMGSTQLEGGASVVCRLDGNLLSLLVDSVGEVIEVGENQFEPAPDIVPDGVRRFLKGIYKINGALLSVVDLDRLTKELNGDSLSTEKLMN